MAKDTYIDPETGKKYKLSDFDDTRSWSKVKKPPEKKKLPNLLGKT